MSKATSQRSSRAVAATVGVMVGVLVIYAVGLQFAGAYVAKSPLDRLAEQFSYVDEQGLHWDYPAMLDAYRACRNSMRQQQLLDLMVVSRAAYLVPDLIDSITRGGFMDTERKIRTIIRLTGHDFSEEFDITGIWGVAPVQRTKARLRQWWSENGQAVIKARGPKDSFDIPNRWSNLRLSLRTEKSRYLAAEPVRLTAVLENRSDVWYTFPYRRPTPAFKIEFFQVTDSGQETRISETRYPNGWIICGNASRWFAPVDHFVIYPGSSRVTQQWVNSDENYLGTGPVAIRAVLTPLYGKHKNRHLTSNDLDIEIVAPQGEDALAYQFLMGTQAMNIGNGRGFRTEWVRFSGLVRNSMSGYNSAADDYFLATYGNSLYSYYVRFTQADVAKWYRDSAGNYQPPNPRYTAAGPKLARRLSEIVKDAPRDFPLLADSYVDLLEHYKRTGELDKMEAVAETVALNELKIIDPDLPQRLEALMAYPRTMIANVNRKDQHGRISLHDAAEKGTSELVRFLLSKEADVNARSRWGTPIFIAAKAGRKDIVEILIAGGADVNAMHGDRSPLFWPVCNGRKELVELLLAHGAEVNVVGKSGRALAEHALLQRQFEVAHVLIEAKGQGGKTPLHWAVEQGRKATVHRFLQIGAPMDAKDDEGRTPLDIAKALAGQDFDTKAILLLLEEYGVTP